MVQKGKFSAGMEDFVKTLKKVDFPTFGSPTIPSIINEDESNDNLLTDSKVSSHSAQDLWGLFFDNLLLWWHSERIRFRKILNDFARS